MESGTSFDSRRRLIDVLSCERMKSLSVNAFCICMKPYLVRMPSSMPFSAVREGSTPTMSFVPWP